MTDRQITQWAPWPDDLEQLVAELDYNEAWQFTLRERDDRDYAPDDHERIHPIAGGTTLDVVIAHRNSYPPHEQRHTGFTFPVPPVTWNRDNWMLWLFDRISEIEQHERMEHFRLVHQPPAELIGRADPLVERPFAPLHGPGNDPNRLHLYAPDDARRTSWRGIVQPA